MGDQIAGARSQVEPFGTSRQLRYIIGFLDIHIKAVNTLKKIPAQNTKQGKYKKLLAESQVKDSETSKMKRLHGLLF